MVHCFFAWLARLIPPFRLFRLPVYLLTYLLCQHQEPGLLLYLDLLLHPEGLVYLFLVRSPAQLAAIYPAPRRRMMSFLRGYAAHPWASEKLFGCWGWTTDQ